MSEKKTEVNKIRNERWDIIMYALEKNVVRHYYKHLYANKLIIEKD